MRMNKIGDFIINKIYCMDCIEALSKIPDNSIDLIITDPPYQFDIATTKNSKGGGFYKHQKKKYVQEIEDSFGLSFKPKLFLELIKTKCKIFNCYIWTNKHLIVEYIQFAIDNGYHYEILIWNKTNPVPVFNGHYLFDKEYCIYIAKKGRFFAKKLGIKPYRTIKNFPIGIKTTTHPTEKPIDFIRDLIKISSQENDIILDPFMGSGTTALASKQLGRNFVGFDINPKYVDMCNKRLNQKTFASGFGVFEK